MGRPVRTDLEDQPDCPCVLRRAAAGDGQPRLIVTPGCPVHDG